MKHLLKDAFVYQNNTFQKADIAVVDGVIHRIGVSIPSDEFDNVFHLNDKYLIPGFVDVHVHLREPGFSYKETIASGTLAAARGGYTAVCAMPNLDPPPDCPAHIQMQLDQIVRTAVIDVYPYACITQGQKGEGSLVDFEALAPYAIAFSDDGRGIQRDALMEEAMRRAKAAGSMIAAHCEVNELLRGGYIHDGVYAREHGHKGICSESEYAQIARDIDKVRLTGCPYHVCHISTKEGVALIRSAKAEGLPVTCETGPHYLTLCDADLQEDGRFKMNPPLRSKADQEALLEGVLDGTIDIIATDHAPHSAVEKAKGLAGSAMGIVGLETAFPVLYTKLVQPGVLSLEKLVQLMCLRPREIFRLGSGLLAPGQRADFAVLDLESQYVIDPAAFLSQGRATPFAGWQVSGENVLTMIEGEIVWQKNLTGK